MKILRLLIAPLAFSIVFLSAQRPALANEYDDSQSHPLRIAAYVAFPFGLLLEWLAARPFHAVVSGTKELEYVFGHRPHPPLFAQPQSYYDYGVAKRVPLSPTVRATRAAPVEPVSEKVTVIEVPVEKIVQREVPKIVEVERVVFPDVAFNFDSARLTELGKGKVYLVAQRLKEKTDIVVAIEGHADYVGSDEYNQRLGMRRAETVMQELSQLGVDPQRMTVVSLGETRPLIDQQADWARALNRRVEFRIAAP